MKDAKCKMGRGMKVIIHIHGRAPMAWKKETMEVDWVRI
jgi:hypothetical protein